MESLTLFDPLTGHTLHGLSRFTVYPSSHYVTPRDTTLRAVDAIKIELADRIKYFLEATRLVEAQRIEQRTRFDLEMLNELGFCKGIENYSRHLSGRKPGEPPPTLIDYLPHDALMFIDESHVTIGQLGGMYKGDRSRKENLVEYGFRLPSALDNRPLRFDEFEKVVRQTTFVSATPANYEREHSGQVVEQLVRPTGLVDPQVEVRPAINQVDDVLSELNLRVKLNERVLITTLTKRMAEDLTEYLADHGVKVRYLHSEVDTVERVEIIRDLRLGEFDVLVGINLLREGPRPAGSVAGGDPRRGQGGVPALGALADPDHRAGRAAHQRQGHPLCRQGHRFDEGGHGRNRAAAQQADRVQPRARHRAQGHLEAHQGPHRRRLRRGRGARDVKGSEGRSPLRAHEREGARARDQAPGERRWSRTRATWSSKKAAEARDQLHELRKRVFGVEIASD